MRAMTELPAALGHRTPVDRVNPKSGRLEPGVGQFRAWLVDRRDGASPLDNTLSATRWIGDVAEAVRQALGGSGLAGDPEFFGIVIYVYYEDHGPPHFHAQYGQRGSGDPIDDLSVSALSAWSSWVWSSSRPRCTARSLARCGTERTDAAVVEDRTTGVGNA